MSTQDDTEQAKRAALELTERDKQAAQIAALEKQLRDTQAQLASEREAREREARERLTPRGDRGQGGITPPDPRTPENIKAEAERYREFAEPSRYASRADDLKAVNAATARDGMAKDQNQPTPQRPEPDQATRDFEAREREQAERAQRLANAPREHEAPSVRLAEMQREDNRAVHAQLVEQQQKEREAAKSDERDDRQAKPDPLTRRRELQAPPPMAAIPVHRQAEAQQRQQEVSSTEAALQRRREAQRSDPSSHRYTALEMTERRQGLARREEENKPLSKEQTEARASRANNSPEKSKEKEGYERG